MILTTIALGLGLIILFVSALGVWVTVSDYFETPEEDRTGFFESQS